MVDPERSQVALPVARQKQSSWGRIYTRRWADESDRYDHGACESSATSWRSNHGESQCHRLPNYANGAVTGRGNRPRIRSVRNSCRTAPASGPATVGAMAGVNVPLYAAEHMYVMTEADPSDTARTCRSLRDTDGYVYVKEDAGKLLVGAFEPNAKPLPLSALPEKFEFGELQEDWHQFELPMSQAMEMIPMLQNVGIRHFMNGPESFTPDNRFIVGEAPELRHFFVGAGFNSQGILSSPGVGKALAEWIVEGKGDHGSLRNRYRALPPLSGQPPLLARPHKGESGASLRHALATSSG